MTDYISMLICGLNIKHERFISLRDNSFSQSFKTRRQGNRVRSQKADGLMPVIDIA